MEYPALCTGGGGLSQDGLEEGVPGDPTIHSLPVVMGPVVRWHRLEYTGHQEPGRTGNQLMIFAKCVAILRPP
jgi:hypothetical protein